MKEFSVADLPRGAGSKHSQKQTPPASQPSTSRGATSRNSKIEVKNNDDEESDEEAPLITKKSSLKRSRTTPDPAVKKV